MAELFLTHHLFPFGLPSLLSMFLPFFMALIILKVGKTNGEQRLFTLCCLFCFLFLFTRCIELLFYSSPVLYWLVKIFYSTSVFLMPITVHYVSVASGRALTRAELAVIYGSAAFMVPALFFTPGTLVPADFSFMAFLDYRMFYLYAFICGWFLVRGLWQVLVRFVYTADNPALKKEHIKALFILIGLIPALTAIYASAFLPFGVLKVPVYYVYIPFGIFLLGIFRYEIVDIDRERLKLFIPDLLTFLIWVPVAVSFFYIVLNYPERIYEDVYQRMIPGAIPPVLSFLTCHLLASFCFKKGNRRVSTLLFGGICSLWGFLNLDIFLLTLVNDGSTALFISRVDHFFLVLQLGLYAHFLYYFGSIRKQWVIFFYVVGLLFMPLTQTPWYLNGTFEYSWGFICATNRLFELFALFAAIEIIIGISMLWGRLKGDPDREKKYQYLTFIIGSMMIAVLGLTNIPAMSGKALYPLSNFMFFPVLILAYGLFRHDIIRINVYTQKKIVIGVVKGMIYLGYMSLPLIGFFFLTTFSMDYLYSLTPLNGIPAFVSFLSCLFFSALSLRQGQYQVVARLFGLISLILALLSLDVMLNAVIPFAEKGLLISRVSHLFFSQLAGLQIHLVYMICKHKKHWWYVHFNYLAGLILGILTQSPWYFREMSGFAWGHFVQAGPALTLFVVLMFFNFLIGIVLLFRFSLSQTESKRKVRAWLFFLAFLMAGIFLAGNIPILYGISFYPTGNFVGIPVILAGSIIYLQNRKEVLELLRNCLYGLIGLLFLFVTSFFIIEIRLLNIGMPMVFAGVGIWFFIALKGASVVRMLLSLVFGERRKELDEAYQGIYDHLGKAYSMEEIHGILSGFLFEEFSSSKTLMIFDQGDQAGFEGWESHNPRQNFFSGRNHQFQNDKVYHSADHLLITLFHEKKQLMTREQVEEWLLSRDLLPDKKDILRQAEIIIPIYFENILLGLICLYEKNDGSAYSEMEKRFLSGFSYFLGPYIENARLHQTREAEIENRTKQLQLALNEVTLMHDISRAVNSTLDLDTIMETFIPVVEKFIPFECVSIQLVDVQRKNLRVHRIYGNLKDQDLRRRIETLSVQMDDADSVSLKCMRQGRPEFIRDYLADEALPSSLEQQVYQLLPFTSLMVFPLEIRNEVVGTVMFFTGNWALHFNESEIDKISRYTSQIATAVNNARLYERSEAAAVAKSDFIARMSHEIRTPLNAVIGAGEMLREMTLPDEKVHYVDVLMHSGELLLAIVNDILEVSKVETGHVTLKSTPFPIYTHLSMLWEMMAPGVKGDRIKFEMHIDETVPKVVKGDPVKLSQVLLNLIANAVRFTQKGKISLTVKPENKDGRNDGVSFIVEDTGEGIPGSELSTIFDSFTQAHDKRGGTGLGLTISRHLSRLMGGDIKVFSTIGEGSTFIFTARLPEVSGEALAELTDSQELSRFYSYFSAKKTGLALAAPIPESHQLPLERTSPLKILLVEDIETNRLVIAGYLSSFSVELHMAECGRAALDKLEQETYDLILLDIELPDMSGLDVLEHLRKNEMETDKAHVPVICISAHLSLESLSDGKQWMDAFLTKPVRKNDLVSEISRVLQLETFIKTPVEKPPGETVEDISENRLLLDQAFKEIVPIFFTEIKEELNIHSQLTKDDLERIKRLGHGFKGAAANLGMEDLKHLFAELKSFADRELLTEVHKSIASIHHYLKQVRVQFVE